MITNGHDRDTQRPAPPDDAPAMSPTPFYGTPPITPSARRIATVMSDTSITFFVEGEGSFTVTRDHAKFDEIRAFITQGNFDEAINAADTLKAVDTFLSGVNSMEVDPNTRRVSFNGAPVPSAMSEKIIHMMTNGQDPSSLIHFLEKLQANPRERAQDELLDFCAVNDFMIFDDGDILGFKSVTSTYRDHHSQSFDNSVGEIVSMPRDDVCDDPTQGCAVGLHVASRTFAEGFHSNDRRLLVVKLSPRDVVSVPLDHGYQKLRCCRYLVVSELTAGASLPHDLGVYSPIDFERAQETVIAHPQ